MPRFSLSQLASLSRSAVQRSMCTSAELHLDASPCRYVCALLSCGLQTGYLLLVERSGAEKGVGTSELLFYNALLSIPFLLTVRSCRTPCHDSLTIVNNCCLQLCAGDSCVGKQLPE